jgi:hypothetical protein
VIQAQRRPRTLSAIASFRRVIEDNPSSPLAATSRLWLIGDEGTVATFAPEPQRTLVHLVAQSVRDWMARELTQDPTQQAKGPRYREATTFRREPP